ncbi:MAG: hypothetical protein U0625_12695 [Phycisphaerales bacterium]
MVHRSRQPRNSYEYQLLGRLERRVSRARVADPDASLPELLALAKHLPVQVSRHPKYRFAVREAQETITLAPPASVAALMAHPGTDAETLACICRHIELIHPPRPSSLRLHSSNFTRMWLEPIRMEQLRRRRMLLLDFAISHPRANTSVIEAIPEDEPIRRVSRHLPPPAGTDWLHVAMNAMVSESNYYYWWRDIDNGLEELAAIGLPNVAHPMGVVLVRRYAKPVGDLLLKHDRSLAPAAADWIRRLDRDGKARWRSLEKSTKELAKAHGLPEPTFQEEPAEPKEAPSEDSAPRQIWLDELVGAFEADARKHQRSVDLARELGRMRTDAPEHLARERLFAIQRANFYGPRGSLARLGVLTATVTDPGLVARGLDENRWTERLTIALHPATPPAVLERMEARDPTWIIPAAIAERRTQGLASIARRCRMIDPGSFDYAGELPD